MEVTVLREDGVEGKEKGKERGGGCDFMKRHRISRQLTLTGLIQPAYPGVANANTYKAKKIPE